MSAIDNGKYRLRKDWASVSIPSLVDIDEHEDDEAENELNTTEPVLPPPKPARRSSLAFTLFSNKSEKGQKRRSSIAVTFFRRDKRENNNKDSSYESTVRREKSDGSAGNNNPDVNFSSDENVQDSNNSAGNEKERNRRRRSSLQVKLDRRRRKNFDNSPMSRDNSPINEPFTDMTNGGNGVRMRTTTTGEYDSNGFPTFYPRQKRSSWWNIFVPDNLKQRSRRASQDVTLMSRSFDNLAVPVRRSKSRSVDHGLAAPFDLDSLRSKVEGRFESVDRLTKFATLNENEQNVLQSALVPSIESGFELFQQTPKPPPNERKKSSLPIIPTVSYTVGNRDTLTSVAARFDTTPSELTQLNRLNSSFIYPGQQLLVPDKNAKDNASTSSSTNDDKGSAASGKSSPVPGDYNEKDILEGLRPGSPKPGHIERVDAQKQADIDKKGDDPVITQRFLKINVRHITDGQGVVGGVLLVTPNAVMFDPNVSDPLVIEHGPESYGVIAPMDLVVNAAIFHDIAHMRVSGGPVNLTNTSTEDNSSDKPEIYYPKAVLDAQQAQVVQNADANADNSTQKHLNAGDIGSVETCDDQESICSGSGRDGDAFPKAFDRERVEDQEKNTEAKDSESGKTDKDDEDEDHKRKLNITDTRTTLEERRKSLLDHHWAIPSKDRICLLSNSRRSSEDEGDNESNTTIDSGARAQDPHSATSSLSGVPTNATTGVIPGAALLTLSGIDLEHLEQLSKQSCYDSGIDIREPIPNVQPIPKKTVYSDADIVLSSDWVPPKTISPTHVSESPSRNAFSGNSSLDTGIPIRKKTSSVSFSVDDNNTTSDNPAANANTQATADKGVEKKSKMLKRLSYPLTWVEGLTGDSSGPPSAGAKSTDNDSAPNTADSNQSVFSKVFSSSPITLVSELGGNLFSKTPSEDSGGSPVPPLTPHSTHSEGHFVTGRSSIGTFMRPHSSEGTASTTKLKDSKQPPQQPKLDYRSMVSVDDKPELFISVDKLIPRPARACPDPPLYLRLRMGKPIGKAIPLPTSVMSYGKNKLRPEYWFSVPKNRVDELYRFIKTWVPHLYGELDEEVIKERGFELIQDDTEWTKSGTTKTGGRTGSQENEEISDLTRESWELIKAPFAKTYNIIKTASHAASQEMDLLSGEVLSMSTDEYRKASLFQTGSFDLDFPIPDLIGNTEILTEEHREKLCGHLPARAEGYSWSLIFSTSQHGFSLNSLYRKMQRLESPVLIVIEDTEHNVFGALTSCSLHVSDHFYGTGESLLYKFNPNFKVFHWTGENLYFIKGNVESLSIGAGDGRFGLWLDGDLNQGRSQSCSTYGNEPLAPREDFVVKTLECWAFV